MDTAAGDPAVPRLPRRSNCVRGAAETILIALFGDAGGFTLTGPTEPAAQRNCPGFREIADEVENARVWGGVHWRSSSETGRTLGHRIGRIALRRLP